MAEKPRRPGLRRDRMSVGVLMLLTAGLALGLWLILPELRRSVDQRAVGDPPEWLLMIAFLLGGLSLVGPPLLLRTARGRTWGAGRLLWFANGTAAWLLWPPVVYLRASRGTTQGSLSAICFGWGTPLMAVYVTAALLAGGHLRRSRRRRLRRSWQETFGLLLGLLWACTGLYLIALFYGNDVFGRR